MKESSFPGNVLFMSPFCAVVTKAPGDQPQTRGFQPEAQEHEHDGQRDKALRPATMAVMGASPADCKEAGTKQAFGAPGGAVVGGLAGSRIGGGRSIAAGPGALPGAAAGGAMGQSPDRADRLCPQQRERRLFGSIVRSGWIAGKPKTPVEVARICRTRFIPIECRSGTAAVEIR